MISQPVHAANPDAVHQTIGVVGLGLVGQAIVGRLRAAGLEVLGFDLREEARTALLDKGGQVTASVRELGTRVSCVVLAVFDTHDVIEVLEGPDGLLAPGHQVRAVLDC